MSRLEIGEILTRYFQLLEKPFSRDWICDFKSMMGFVQSNPETNRILKAIHEEKIEYVTANMVMNLAARSKEIFLSSEVAEKRQILNLVFQNLKLDNQKNLILEVKEPFLTMMGIKNGTIRLIDCR